MMLIMFVFDVDIFKPVSVSTNNTRPWFSRGMYSHYTKALNLRQSIVMKPSIGARFHEWGQAVL